MGSSMQATREHERSRRLAASHPVLRTPPAPRPGPGPVAVLSHRLPGRPRRHLTQVNHKGCSDQFYVGGMMSRRRAGYPDGFPSGPEVGAAAERAMSGWRRCDGPGGDVHRAPRLTSPSDSLADPRASGTLALLMHVDRWPGAAPSPARIMQRSSFLSAIGQILWRFSASLRWLASWATTIICSCLWCASSDATGQHLGKSSN